MIQIHLNGKDVNLATSLRVIYELKNMLGCKTLQAALKQIQELDLDNQIKLLYTAYKCGKNEEPTMTSEKFTDVVLDEMGMIKISKVIADIVDGFMYAGLSEEEKEAEKAKNSQRERSEISAGQTSSDTDTE